MKKLLTIIAFAAFCVFHSFAGDDIKTNIRTALVMAYSPANSVYEDDNIKIEIYNEKVWATNKTSKTIFLDMSQCFSLHNGSSYPMYEKEQDEKNASKTKVSTSIEEFVSIPPAVGNKQNDVFICPLAGTDYGSYTTTESPSGHFSEYDERFRVLINELVNESLEGDPKGENCLGTAYRHLTEDESISTIGVALAYAFNKRSEEWNNIVLSTWVSDAYLTPYWVQLPKEIKEKEKRGFGVKKTEAAKVYLKADSPFEFEQDKSPVIVCDWTGNYRKGTFNLVPVIISKKKGMSVGKALFATFATVATGGAGAVLFMNDESTYFKKEIIFCGENANWGKMKYLNNDDLSKFNNKR